jgi:hypothetical protein
VLHGDVIHNFKNGEDSTSDGLHLSSTSSVEEESKEEGPPDVKSFCFQVNVCCTGKKCIFYIIWDVITLGLVVIGER